MIFTRFTVKTVSNLLVENQAIKKSVKIRVLLKFSLFFLNSRFEKISWCEF